MSEQRVKIQFGADLNSNTKYPKYLPAHRDDVHNLLLAKSKCRVTFDRVKPKMVNGVLSTETTRNVTTNHMVIDTLIETGKIDKPQNLDGLSSKRRRDPEQVPCIDLDKVKAGENPWISFKVGNVTSFVIENELPYDDSFADNDSIVNIMFARPADGYDFEWISAGSQAGSGSSSTSENIGADWLQEVREAGADYPRDHSDLHCLKKDELMQAMIREQRKTNEHLYVIRRRLFEIGNGLGKANGSNGVTEDEIQAINALKGLSAIAELID